jgi:FtsP/CotA-like multicopper oxidase with cupredoxin domain
MDGNPVPSPQTVDVLQLNVAERIDAVVEMNQPGFWVLGSPRDPERSIGMGVVVEYAGQQGEPKWITPRILLPGTTPFSALRRRIPNPMGSSTSRSRCGRMRASRSIADDQRSALAEGRSHQGEGGKALPIVFHNRGI